MALSLTLIMTLTALLYSEESSLLWWLHTFFPLLTLVLQPLTLPLSIHCSPVARFTRFRCYQWWRSLISPLQNLSGPFFPILTLQNSCLVKSSHYLSIHSHAYIQTTTHTMRKKECPDPCYHSEDHSSQMSTRNSMAISPRCSSELTPVSQLISFFARTACPFC